jgi:hypothetical protein
LRTAWWTRLAAIVLVVSSPVVTWWSVGPNPGNEYRNDPTRPADTWDYLFHPPVIDPATERAIVITAIAVVSVAAAAVLTAALSGRLDRRWWPPIIAMTVAGVYVGAAERVMTAAVSSANIGGGLMILFGVPFLVVLVGGSVIWSSHTLRTTRLVDG